MWSPNELLKTEKQRDILSYITLQFFPFKKVPLEHYPNAQEFCLWATKKIFSAVLRMTSNSRKNLYSVNHICDFYFIIRE